mmetsp:Transcript_60727/g.167971  ORF Transcript_60727/g.167971 Transcript_60727/m.167971 type:complete len:244 (+) Transcript_60727:65-796(+)
MGRAAAAQASYARRGAHSESSSSSSAALATASAAPLALPLAPPLRPSPLPPSPLPPPSSRCWPARSTLTRRPSNSSWCFSRALRMPSAVLKVTHAKPMHLPATFVGMCRRSISPQSARCLRKLSSVVSYDKLLQNTSNPLALPLSLPLPFPSLSLPLPPLPSPPLPPSLPLLLPLPPPSPPLPPLPTAPPAPAGAWGGAPIWATSFACGMPCLLTSQVKVTKAPTGMSPIWALCKKTSRLYCA